MDPATRAVAEAHKGGRNEGADGMLTVFYIREREVSEG